MKVSCAFCYSTNLGQLREGNLHGIELSVPLHHYQVAPLELCPQRQYLSLTQINPGS